MTLDNMTGITEGSYTGFCKSQLITCNRVKECNGVCPFEDALKHADKTQTMNVQHTVDHDRDWIIGCIEHDGFIHTHRFDKANQIIHDALSADAEQVTGKLNKRDDSLLKSDSDECKEQKSKLDLISREEVLRMIIVAGECEPDLGYTHLHTVIESLPSAEPKTGKWILDPNGMDWNIPAWRCSECGFVANYIGVEAKGFGNNPMNWAGSKFCPQCGARITGYER